MPLSTRASRALRTRRSLVPSRRKPLSETWLNCEDPGRSRRLARLRLRPTGHTRRSFLVRASRALPTRRSLVPSRRKPLSETCSEDPGRSRRLARLRLRPTGHTRRSFLVRASRALPTRRSLVPPRRKPLSETWLNCEDPRRSRRLARLRLRPTGHTRRSFLVRASRALPTRRSLVPPRRKPLSETWLNCEDPRRSRRLARLRLRPTGHTRRSFLVRASRALPTRRSLVPPRRKPLSETWLNCEDPRRSRRLDRCVGLVRF